MTTGVGSFETYESNEGGPTPVTKRVSPTDRIRADIDQLFAAADRPLAEVLGAEAALSRSTVSRICQSIREEFAVWSARRLDDIELDYLFLDASCFRMHPNSPAEPVLAAWGIDTEGKPVFIGLAPAGS